eukprot:NODE_7890_length_573_cov_1.441704_g7867_i0.p2 GENE.NODE_7890_length_573_cov_1.441704_g7867_i0~~NODE_7890_length_573_cov_1.441704_g7867_i0.p2  ORF type:complete len:100 (+),score=5.49 NODE_7890_length_573_cov_1.441704_g7867_i0:214-513(+)
MQVAPFNPVKRRFPTRSENAVIVVTPQIRMHEEGVAIAIEEIKGTEATYFLRHIGDHLQAAGEGGDAVIPERRELIEQIAEGMLAIRLAHRGEAGAYQG